VNGSTRPIILAVDELLNFDQMAVSVNFSLLDVTGDTVSIEVKSQNGLPSYVLALIRIELATILALFLIPQIAVLSSPKILSLEPQLTIALNVCTFCYVNPLYVIDLVWPSPALRVAMLLVRDAFSAFLAFYVLALLTHFGRDPEENQLLSLALPYLYFLISVIILLVKNTLVPFFETTRVMPESFAGFNARSEIDFAYFGILIVLFGGGLVYAHQHSFETQLSRLRFHAQATVSMLLISCGYLAAVAFVPWFHDRVYGEALELALFTCSALLMDAGHASADVSLEVNCEAAGDNSEAGDLGLELDSPELPNTKSGQA
jgi:hypothetical protein